MKSHAFIFFIFPIVHVKENLKNSESSLDMTHFIMEKRKVFQFLNSLIYTRDERGHTTRMRSKLENKFDKNQIENRNSKYSFCDITQTFETDIEGNL